MANAEKHEFQAEIKQLLDIVVHSLYTDKEIFIRELISNAADACEKLRFLQSAGTEVYQADEPVKISIATDDTAKTISITDTGIGMTHDELVENLGTIAHSGSKAFLKQLQESKKADPSLIGQFGVGFYSAFMVATEVEVFTRTYQGDHSGFVWSSDGSGSYEISEAKEWPRGTRVLVKLKDDEKDFSQASKVESIIKRYSNFVPFPIELNGEVVNKVSAIWARNKNEIKDEDYNEFYQFIGHDHEGPLCRLHFTADAPLAIQALLFVPSKNFEALGLGKSDSEVNLYCRKILIEPKAKGLFPDWLRFLKGVVDSEDLPLNISRESMQDSTLMQKLNKVITSRFLKYLDEVSNKEAEKYDTFYDNYNRFLKEGVVTDFTHKDALGKLLRYESSATENGKRTSLADYVQRMREDQKEIYYIFAPTRESAESSPYLEVLRAKKYEVLYMTDPWDEFVMDHLARFEEKPVCAAERSELKLDEPAKDEDESKDKEALSDDEAKDLVTWLKETLGDKVGEVRVSERLVDSPGVVVDSDKMMSSSMRRMMKGMNQEAGATKLDLEINPKHLVIARLDKMRGANKDVAAMSAEQVFDNARMAAGLVEDPRSMVGRLNELLGRVLEKQ